MKEYSTAALDNALQCGGFTILEQDEQGLMILSPLENLVMMKQDNPETARSWLLRHEEEAHGYPLVCMQGKELCDLFAELYPGKARQDVQRYIWTKSTAPKGPRTLFYRDCIPEDYQWIRERYALSSDEELKIAIERKNILLAFEDEEPVGFAGLHLEGSMGMLVVFEGYQRKGYAKEIEARIIDKALKQGLVPYCEVFEGNEISMHLQEVMGLEPFDETVAWFFEPEDGTE